RGGIAPMTAQRSVKVACAVTAQRGGMRGNQPAREDGDGAWCDPAGQCVAAAAAGSCPRESNCSVCAAASGERGGATAPCLTCPPGYQHFLRTAPRPWRAVDPSTDGMPWRGFDCSGECVKIVDDTSEDEVIRTNSLGGMTCSTCKPPLELIGSGLTHPKVVASAPAVDSVYSVDWNMREDFLRKGVVMARQVAPELLHYRPFFQEAYVSGMVQYYYYNLMQEPCTCERSPGGSLCAAAAPKDFPYDPLYLQDLAKRRDVTTLRAMLQECAKKGNATVGFFQQMDLRRLHPVISKWALGKRLARVASELLGVPALRLYQDAMFVKDGRIGDDSIHLQQHKNRHTGWHMELTQVPVDTEAYVTAWCPLHPANDDDSILAFAPGSHEAGSWSRVWKNNSPRLLPVTEDVHTLVSRIRQISSEVKSMGTLPKEKLAEFKEKGAVLSTWKAMLARPVTLSERQRKLMTSTNLDLNNKFHMNWAARFRIMTFRRYEVGDCSFHSGRVMHAAPSNTAASKREAVTLTFIDAKALKMPMDYHKITNEDKLSYQKWFDDIKDWDEINHPQLPLVYNRSLDPLFVPFSGHQGDRSTHGELKR
ncbi:hypothetical protein CYMTET_27378, partial [Cymbomonas tetramitiformis]